MAERSVKGDYIGFTFGGVHSSELGLMRVSDGSRYNEDLLPPLQDKTVQVNGRDGAVYFGSQYNTRPIKVPVAFDNMTEESFNQLKRLLQDKKPKYLWFDETPYKQWLVKAANVQNFKWVCFDESQNIARENDGDPVSTKKRIYKGEGTLEFSCFSSYAENRVKFWNDSINKLEVWRKIGNTKRLDILEDNEDIGLWFSYRSVIERNFSQNIPSYSEKPKNEFFCYTTRRVDGSNSDAVAKAYFDQSSLSKVRRIFCFYFNNGYFDGKMGSWYEPHWGNWYNFANNQEVSNDIVEQYIPDSVEQFLEDNDSDYAGDIPFLMIMDTQGNIYPVVKQSNYRISSGGKTYYYDPNYPVTVCFRKKMNLSCNYNFEEWINASHIPYSINDLSEIFNISNEDGIPLYNSGDISTPLQIFYLKEENENEFPGGELALCRFSYADYNTTYENEGYIRIKPFKFYAGDSGFIIDSKIKMIKGIDENNQITGTNYNKYIQEGDFFKLPPSMPYSDLQNEDYTVWMKYFEYRIKGSKNTDEYIEILPGFKKVEYKYYYI